MLFNSSEFIFAFLPLCLMVYWGSNYYGYNKLSILWLVTSSLFFYGWWNPVYLLLIISSIGFNYTIGFQLGHLHSVNGDKKKLGKFFLTAGIIFNLGILAYFKYANFFVENVNEIFSASFNLEHVILPLAISFFTFQQIAFLVDAYRGETKEYNFLHYCLFVTFFPQLIAGPIVHHKEMLPQFMNTLRGQKIYQNLSLGSFIFVIGLFKKVVLADGAGYYVTRVFTGVEDGSVLSLFPAWGGVLLYTFQIYFDFSGYSDMAIGIAKMFGIHLPVNFHSPYKAFNIIDFWRRWHISLSRFLKDYVYFSLGGNRNGTTSRYINIMATMLLGGLWHGAGWTFVFWGMLHGTYLIINHAWQALFPQTKTKTLLSWIKNRASQGLTFGAVVIAWVFFRADTFNSATSIVKSMFGFNGVALPETYLFHFNGVWGGAGDFLATLGLEYKFVEFYWGIAQVQMIVVLFMVAWLTPNTQQIFSDYKFAIETYKEKFVPWIPGLKWHPTRFWALIFVILAITTVSYLKSYSEFLYFRF